MSPTETEATLVPLAINAIETNVSDFYGRRITYAVFSERQRELWRSIESRPNVHDRVLAHFRRAMGTTS